VARTSLREASEFANKKKMLKMKFTDNKIEWDKNYFKDTLVLDF
jgi:hypothetical protein